MPGIDCTFTAMQLDPSTDKMFKIMRQAFGKKFQITQKLIPESFAAAMFKSLTATIEETRLRVDKSKTAARNP